MKEGKLVIIPTCTKRTVVIGPKLQHVDLTEAYSGSEQMLRPKGLHGEVGLCFAALLDASWKSDTPPPQYSIIPKTTPAGH